jgi:hypothetical protein
MGSATYKAKTIRVDVTDAPMKMQAKSTECSFE